MAVSDNARRRPTQPHNDNGPVPPRPPSPPRNLGDDFIMGLRFFSRLPSGDRPHLPPDLDRIAMALPFASLVIGLLPVLLLLAAALAGLPGLVVGGLAVGAAALVTGAMAEDALADAADGLFGGATRERRLEIMKDSRHGTYGVVALCLFLLLRVAGLAALVGRDPLSGVAIWLGLTVLARSGALGLTVALPNARPGGIAATAGRVGKPAFLIGALFALLIGLVLVAPGAGVLGFVAAGAAMALVAWGWTVLCRRLVGGQTGDLIGALQALLELTGLVVVLLAV